MAHPGDIYQFVANIDFDFPNLRVKAGQPLPDRWQHRELVRRLQQKHGEDCVSQRVVNFRRESKAKEVEVAVLEEPVVEEASPQNGRKRRKAR